MRNSRSSLPPSLALFLTAVLSVAPPVRAQDARSQDVIETARSSVRLSAEWLASGVDSWFGDKPFKEGGSVTDGRASVGLLKRQDQNFDIDLRFNARFRLPNLEEHTYFFVGRDNPRDVINDKPGMFSRQQQLVAESTDERSFFAGLGRTVSDSVDFRIGFRGGLNPYVQGRYRKPWTMGPADLVEFRQTLFWSVDDHLGSTTALSWERAFSPTLAGRWLSAATITRVTRKFEWHSSLGAYKALGGRRLLSVEALANGKQGAGVAVTDYGLQSRWEQPLHKDWLRGELIVGHFWPRAQADQPRGRAWAVGGTLKMSF